MNEKIIQQLQHKVTTHPIYARINTLENLKIFMQAHIFAVWDFMSLLKALQKRFTCVEIPWRPSRHASTTRMINQIVLGEESDLDQHGVAISHFELYLRAMTEVGADTQPIQNFLQDLSLSKIPQSERRFVSYHLELASDGTDEAVMAAFLFGRELPIPHMFEAIVASTDLNAYPSFLYYLKRHIELDSESHGPLAQQCLELICGTDQARWQRAYQAGQQALEHRLELWDETLKRLK